MKHKHLKSNVLHSRVYCRVLLVLLLLTLHIAGTTECQAVVLGKEAPKAVVQPVSGYHPDNVLAWDNKLQIKDGELIVKYRPNISRQKRDAKHKTHGSRRIKEYAHLRMEHVKLDAGETISKALHRLRTDPDVEYAEPNYMVKALSTPNDNYYNLLWGMTAMQAPTAWNKSTGSNDVVVAVIDTGIDYNHPDIKANLWINSAELNGTSGTDDDVNGYKDDIYGWNSVVDNGDPIDHNGHGTHVAGTIGAVGNNGLGVAGVNWNVKILACKFLDDSGSGATSDAIECLEYVRTLKNKGVNIVATNNSWGGPGYSQALYDAIKAQEDAGILFIAAAGNSAADLDSPGANDYPALFTQALPNGPLGLSNVITVAATDVNENLAWFSNTGRTAVQVGAPGVDIVSLRAAGTNPYGDTTHFVPDGDTNAEYYRLNGTSMATPHVTGLAALLKADNPGRDWRSIKNLIISGGDKIPALENKTASGKRINLAKSLSCTDQTVLSAVQIPKALTIGVPTVLSVMSINCDLPIGPVTVTFNDPSIPSVELLDDGQGADQAAGDGIYSGMWTPTSSDFITLTFTSPLGSISYSIATDLSTNFGAPLDLWEITLPVDGQMPGPAMAIGADNKIHIVGTSAAGMEVLAYAPDNALLWRSTIAGGDRGKSIAADTSGATYMLSNSGELFRFADDGTLLWRTTTGLAAGQSMEGQRKLVLEADGTVAVLGGDPSDGKTILIKRFSQDSTLISTWYYTDQNSNNLTAGDMVADANRNFYVIASKNTVSPWTDYDVVLVKLNSAGTAVWTRQYNSRGEATNGSTWWIYEGRDTARSVLIDKRGYVLVSTIASYYSYGNKGSYLTYDQNGNLLFENFTTPVAANQISEPWYGEPIDMDINSSNHVMIGGRQYYYAYFDYYSKLINVDLNNPAIAYGRWDGRTKYTAATAVKHAANDDLYIIKNSSSNKEAYLSKSQYSLYYVTRSLPEGELGVPYQTQLQAKFGAKPYTWSVAGGVLPDGLTLDSVSGVISGTPTQTGDYAVYIRLTDATGGKITNTGLSITINNNPAVTTGTVPNAVVNTPYSQQLSGAGGIAPYTWSIVGGPLPDGLLFDAATATISGAALVDGTFAFTVKISDSLSNSSTKDFVLTVDYTPPVIQGSLPPLLEEGRQYDLSLGVLGGLPPFSFEIIAGALPAGMTISSTGRVVGTPIAAGGTSLTLRLTDSRGNSTDANWSPTVQANGGMSAVSDDQLVLPANPVLGSAGRSVYTFVGNDLAEYAATVHYEYVGRMLYYTLAIIKNNIPQFFYRFPNIASSPQYFTGLLVDESGSVYLSFTTNNSTEFVMKFVNGNVAWSTSSTGSAYFKDGTKRLQFGPSDIRYLRPGATIALLNRQTGAIISSITAESDTIEFASDSSGNVITAGRNDVNKYTASGTKLWTYSFSTDYVFQYLQGIAVDSADNIIVAGSGGFPFTLALGKLSPLGTLSWTKYPSSVYDSNANCHNYYSPCVVTTMDDLIFIGSTTLALFEGNGSILGVTHVNGADSTTGVFPIKGTSDIFLTGKANIPQTSNYNYFFHRYHLGVDFIAQSVAPATVGSPYQFQMQVKESFGPYTWQATTPLPGGLTLDTATGVISGIPLSAGDYDFTISVVSSKYSYIKGGHTYHLTVLEPLLVNNAALPAGTTGISYQVSLIATGGAAPYSWSITGGSLPAGLTLDAAAGTLSGTPTTAGSSSFTVQVADNGSNSTAQAFSITIANNLTINTTALPDGTTGSIYSHTLSSSGGYGAYSWNVSAGTLPQGLNLSADGIISGTPTTAGSSNITFLVTDSSSNSTSQSFTISIISNLAVSSNILSSGIAGSPYSQTIGATGGYGSYSWSLASGTLPAGLVLNANGIISGTPTEAGSSSSTVKVIDAGGNSAVSTVLSITVIPAAPVVTTAALADGYTSSAYNQTLTASNGTYPLSWSIASGSLPTGLSLTAATGVIGGAPTAAGPFSFTAQVIDASGRSVQKSMTITIYTLPSISTSTLATGTVGSTYSATLAATGAKAPYTWSISSGSMPSGLTLNAATGVISGTPTVAVTSISITFQVTDANGKTAAKALNLTINPKALTFGTTALPDGYLTTAYSTSLTATGGKTPYSWSITSTTKLPTGLTLNASTGVITGTPTVTVTGSSITFRVTDAAGTTASKSLTISVYALPAISTASLAAGTTGTAYSATLAATGGKAALTWSISSGALPAGLSLSNAGVISGTPSAAAAATSVTFTVTDANGKTATKALSITINNPPLAVSTATLPDGYLTGAYSTALAATGGKTPYTWSITSTVKLPAGLTLNATTGTITGTPTATVTGSSITFRVTDAAGATASKTMTISVYALPAISTATLANGTVGSAYNATLAATGGKSAYIWNITSGSLPAGLTMSTAGVISGTPSAATAATTVTFTVTDANGKTSSKALSITVAAAPPAVAALNSWSNLYSAAPGNTSATGLAAGSISVGTGTNRLLLVAVALEIGTAANPTVSASLGGVALTQIKVTNSTQREIVWVGYLKESQIGSGSKALTVSYSGATGNVSALHVKWAAFSGANQTTPVVSSGGNNTATTSATFGSAINYVANGMTTVVSANGGTPATAALSATPAFTAGSVTTTNAQSSASFTSARHSAAGSYAATTAVTWSGTTSSRSATVAVSLQP
ncbi:MAG TPA: S8 family serine peptidase [Desulfuromonadales bacterium]|nr:S8 family serine peptidase [Desulfuromonadales bacterium]